MRLVEDGETAVYYKVNDDFDSEPSAKIVSRHLYQINLGLLSYFEACRSPKKRSLLNANEHFEDEQDAKIANKTNLFSEVMVGKLYILLPIVTIDVVLAGAKMISNVTTLNRRVGRRHLLAGQTLEAIQFIYGRCVHSREELALGVCPIVESCAGNIYGTGRDEGNQTLLVYEECLLVVIIFIVVVAEPVREDGIDSTYGLAVLAD